MGRCEAGHSEPQRKEHGDYERSGEYVRRHQRIAKSPTLHSRPRNQRIGPVPAYVRLGREIYQNVKAEDAPRTVERILKGYLAHREGDETFLMFSKRHEAEALKAMFDGVAA